MARSSSGVLQNKLEKLNRYTPTDLIFNVFSSEEIRDLSVVKVITPLSFNALGHALPGGLYDPCLGPFDKSTPCGTCRSLVLHCPGHFGHVELPLPVVNPLFHKPILTLLKISCISCFRILIPAEIKCILRAQVKLLDAGHLAEAVGLSERFAYLDASFGSEERDAGSRLEALAAVDDYVADVLSGAEPKVVHAGKGQGDFRSDFVKSALSQVCRAKKCPYCGYDWKRVSSLRGRILVSGTKVEVAKKFSDGGPSSKDRAAGTTYLTPTQCLDYCRKIWEKDSATLEVLVPVLKNSTSEHPTDVFCMSVVPVTPTNSRPLNMVKGVAVEHPQNGAYKAILNNCLVIRSIVHLMNSSEADGLTAERKEIVENLRGSTYTEKLQLAWQELQTDVDCIVDADARKTRNVTGIGLKQVMEKKDGIIRMNMMGKRVNFAARSVITPDPNLNIDEIGVPEAFAKRLTYPVPVTTWNAAELRKLVSNGPDVHPGANFVEEEDGKIIKLNGSDPVQRESVGKRLLTPGGGGGGGGSGGRKGVKILHRHLSNGDVLLLNRQPTLHRPSLMAHRARILKGEKTLRLHYANCKAYNADFDGDEMNAHFPQNEVARSEGYNLVSVSKQYLVPKDGTPLSGLIQDHVVSGVRLTTRGKFFTEERYMQLVFQGLSYLQGDVRTLPPAILKPVRLWSGKQIVSTVLINITPRGKELVNLTSRAKIGYKAWEKKGGRKCRPGEDPAVMSEAEVVIRGGELLCGVLDKTHYGATPYSLVHCVYELYGGEVSSRLLSSLAKLFTAFLQTEGFTLGVEDILVVSDADRKRRSLVELARRVGDTAARNALDLPPDSESDLREALREAHWKVPLFRAVLDHEFKRALDSYTNDINKVCLPAGLFTPFPRNNLQLMVQSGAKGSTVNTMQISCLLGQIELEGKRPPITVSGRSLPSFPPFETSPRSGGFIDGRFMTGIGPQEFFFHCMAGREGLIDTAVKTSRSGYLQRCLVKHLEGLSVHYDMTVRDSDGSVVQFAYGEDGMEIGKCQFLKEEQIPFLVENLKTDFDPDVHRSLLEGTDVAGIREHRKKLRKWRKHGGGSAESSPFTLFSREMSDRVDAPPKINTKTGRSRKTEQLIRMWQELDERAKARYEKKCRSRPDPISSKFQSDRHLGAITEKLETIMNNYLEKNGGDGEEVRRMVEQKALLSTCEAGEPVGLLAAQSVGEPSTQMTLNTFHFAGRGEMNVTLGIPRLREILMVASKKIKTPAVEVPFRSDLPSDEKYADRLRKYLARVTLADVLESVSVTERVVLKPEQKQVYILKMKFLPHSAYKENTSVKPKEIIRHVEKKFLKEIVESIDKKKKKTDVITSEQEQRKFKEEEDDVGQQADKDSPEEETSSKKKKKAVGDADDYESSEEEEEGEDDDATTARRRERQQEETQYSDMEDEVDEETREELEATGEDDEGFQEEEAKEDDRSVGENLSVLRAHHTVHSYRYDRESYRWCEVTLNYKLSRGRIDFGSLLRERAGKSVVAEVAGIRRAFTSRGSAPGSPLVLKTDGINFREMMNHDRLLDLRRLYSNDVHAMASTYGIEAASRVILKEVQDVFKVYGITVDSRHLSLIADYMTFSGKYLPLNRQGMEGGSSPLQQMSFEASLGFLKSSVLGSRRDDLRSPSSRLVVGLPCRSGTGAFNLLHKIAL